MSDEDSESSLPLPMSPPRGRRHDDDDSDSESDNQRPRKLLRQESDDKSPPPGTGLDDIPYPVDTKNSVPTLLLSGGHDIHHDIDIPLPPDSSDNKYSPSQAAVAAGDMSPVTTTAAGYQKKTVAVLGRAQAKKRLQAFSAAKLAASSTTTSSSSGAGGIKKISPIKGVSVFSGRSSDSSKQPQLAIATIKEEETKMKEIMAMNNLLSEKLKAVHTITNPEKIGPGPVTAIVKPTMISTPPIIETSGSSSSSSRHRPKKSSPPPSSSLASLTTTTTMPVIMDTTGSSSRHHSKRSRSPSSSRHHRSNRSRSPSSSRRHHSKRSRSPSSSRRHHSKRSRSPSSSRHHRSNRSRSPSSSRHHRSKKSPISLPSLAPAIEASASSSRRHRSKRSPTSSSSSTPPPPAKESSSRHRSKRSHSSSSSSSTPPKESRRSKKSPSSSKSKKKKKDREREREKEKERERERERKERKAEKRREREMEEARIAYEKELDKVRTKRMPTDWLEYKKFQYRPDYIRSVWDSIEEKEDRSSKTKSHSRSSARSPPPRGSVEIQEPTSLMKSLSQSSKLIKTTPIELKSNLKGEYPLLFLKTTKQKPSLSYGCNPLSFAGYYKSRDQVFKSEDPEVVKLMVNFLERNTPQKSQLPLSEVPKVKDWFASSEQVFCPSEGSKSVVISHLYSDDEMMDDSPKVVVQSAPASSSKHSAKDEQRPQQQKKVKEIAVVPSPPPSPLEQEAYSDNSMDSVPSPLLKKRYDSDLPTSSSSLHVAQGEKVVFKKDEELSISHHSDDEDDDDEMEVNSEVEEKSRKPSKRKKEKKKKKKKDSKKSRHHHYHSSSRRGGSRRHPKSDDDDDNGWLLQSYIDLHCAEIDAPIQHNDIDIARQMEQLEFEFRQSESVRKREEEQVTIASVSRSPEKGAQDLLRTFDEDALLQLVLENQDLSAENLLSRIKSEPQDSICPPSPTSLKLVSFSSPRTFRKSVSRSPPRKSSSPRPKISVSPRPRTSISPRRRMSASPRRRISVSPRPRIAESPRARRPSPHRPRKSSSSPKPRKFSSPRMSISPRRRISISPRPRIAESPRARRPSPHRPRKPSTSPRRRKSSTSPRPRRFSSPRSRRSYSPRKSPSSPRSRKFSPHRPRKFSPSRRRKFSSPPRYRRSSTSPRPPKFNHVHNNKSDHHMQSSSSSPSSPRLQQFPINHDVEGIVTRTNQNSNFIEIIAESLPVEPPPSLVFGANPSNLIEIVPAETTPIVPKQQVDKSSSGYSSPPKRRSLDERLELEMGINLRDEIPAASQYSHPHFPGGYPLHLHGQHGSMFPPLPEQNTGQPSVLGPQGTIWPKSVAPLNGFPPVGAVVGPPQPSPFQRPMSQTVQMGDDIQIFPAELPEKPFTISKHNSKLNPLEVQQLANFEVPARKDDEQTETVQSVIIKIPTVPFKFSFARPTEAEQQQQRRHRDFIKHRRRRKAKKRSQDVVSTATEKESESTEENKSSTDDKEKLEETVDPEELELLKEAISEVPTDLSEEPPPSENVENSATNAILETDDIDRPDDMKEADEHEEEDAATTENLDEAVSPIPVYVKKLPALPDVIPSKGILVVAGFRERIFDEKDKSSKGVVFLDGVKPGYGTSRSEGEDMSSPPPASQNKVLLKKKVRERKKKIKVKTVRREEEKQQQQQQPPQEDVGVPGTNAEDSTTDATATTETTTTATTTTSSDDSNPSEPPLPATATTTTPPPPPKVPYPYCPLGILYLFNPPYAVLYAQSMAEYGFEVTFEPTTTIPKSYSKDNGSGGEQ